MTVTDASGQPVQFTSPVHLTVQFKNRPDPTESDVAYFSGGAAKPAEIRLVQDMLAGEPVHFAFTGMPWQIVSVPQGTLTVSGFVGLTGPDGRGTFGAVADELALRAAHWRFYR